MATTSILSKQLARMEAFQNELEQHLLQEGEDALPELNEADIRICLEYLQKRKDGMKDTEYQHAYLTHFKRLEAVLLTGAERLERRMDRIRRR
jgi:negative regulator of sigma E activity